MKDKSPIIVIDYGMGNIASVLNMIHFVGGEARLSVSPDEVREAQTLILPGIGSFDAGIKALHDTGMDVAIHEAVDRGATILGICLGMQLFMDSSEEGRLPGLGLVPGKVKRFQVHDLGLRVPHMGWNVVRPARASILFDPGPDEQRFYFVHSYYVECDDPRDVTGVTRYGQEFTSSLERGRVIGVQFHPEKSHRFGMNLFKRLMEA